MNIPETTANMMMLTADVGGYIDFMLCKRFV